MSTGAPTELNSSSRAGVPRPDRAGKVAMTTRVSPRLRQIYRELSGRLGVKMEDLQCMALRSVAMGKLARRSRREQQAVWAELLKAFPEHCEDEAGDD